MEELAEMRKLKIEETTLIKMLDVLKKQLNRLKIEELILASKMREEAVVESSPSLSVSPSKPSTSNVINRCPKDNINAISDCPEVVNKLNLNLFIGSGRGQTSQVDGESEEMDTEGEEEEDDGDDDDEDVNENKDPLVSFLDY